MKVQSRLIDGFDLLPELVWNRDEMTNLRKTEIKSVADREAHLRLILDNTLDAIIILDDRGRITGFYRSAQSLFGYSEDEPQGQPLSILFPANYQRRFNLMFEQQHQPGQLIDFREQIKAMRANGEEFHAEVGISTICDSVSTQYIITVKDNTQQYLAQEALYREKEQAQVTLNSIADGVITTDVVGQITYINPAALKLTGLRFDEVMGQKIDRAITIDSERDEIPVFECIRKGSRVDSIGGDLLISKSGEEFVVHQVASPIHRQNGDTVGSVMIFRDVSKSYRLAGKLSWQASHDDLTRLINRREFERRLGNLIEEAGQESTEHCVCFLDLDKFKVVNDTCGHVAGDELLRQLAGIIQSKIRDADTLARLGGDEFAIILSQCAVEPALKVAEEIRAAVEDFRFGWGGQSFQVAVSIGVVLINADSPDPGEVFKAADSACYAAKEAGRNRVHVFSQDDEEISLRRGEAQWMLRIQQALVQNRFELAYQPIVPVSDHRLQIHYEILLRMVGDEGEMIPPGAFLPAAERYQMMSQVDWWVVKNLFEWMSAHWDYGVNDIFAVNLSGQSLADENLLYRIKKLFSEYAVPAERICFEITETAAISNLSKAQAFIGEMKLLGCLFALDDFGSGLSSFAYLKSLPVNYLKIDGAFVKDMHQDPIDHAMVESIHNIGSVLNLQTIAEFVEHKSILQSLEKVGVHFAQGYGIARPERLPASGGELFGKK
jgi:diguanylate cyclase (GGDEF)-like protein/PAS domain S-box-containing protein